MCEHLLEKGVEVLWRDARFLVLVPGVLPFGGRRVRIRDGCFLYGVVWVYFRVYLGDRSSVFLSN